MDVKARKIKMDRPGSWVFIVPVSGVELTDSVNNEFRIKRVLLVDRKKLPRIRRRLRLPRRISEIKKHYPPGFFESANTYAVVHHSGTPGKVRVECRRIVQDELSILALSQLGCGKRRFGSYPAIKGEYRSGVFENILHSRKDDRYEWHGSSTGKSEDLQLDARWKECQRYFFFHRLLKILREEIKVRRTWRDTLERAAILAGQSQCLSDVAQAFLWNMVAMELLLVDGGDKHREALLKRLEALLGWVGFWKERDYSAKINGVYDKRCNLVHDGDRKAVTVDDLLFTDDLLLNLLWNLVLHPKLFFSKGKVIEFSRRVEAERILGVKHRVHPKPLYFISITYSEKDRQEI